MKATNPLHELPSSECLHGRKGPPCPFVTEWNVVAAQQGSRLTCQGICFGYSYDKKKDTDNLHDVMLPGSSWTGSLGGSVTPTQVTAPVMTFPGQQASAGDKNGTPSSLSHSRNLQALTRNTCFRQRWRVDRYFPR